MYHLLRTLAPVDTFLAYIDIFSLHSEDESGARYSMQGQIKFYYYDHTLNNRYYNHSGYTRNSYLLVLCFCLYRDNIQGDIQISKIPPSKTAKWYFHY